MKKDKEQPSVLSGEQENYMDRGWHMPPGDGPSWEWVEGTVDTKKKHMKLFYGKILEGTVPVALLARGTGKKFIVQFIIDAGIPEDKAKQMKKAVTGELNYYLIELHETDPWGYALYLATTASNLYSDVHWQYCPIKKITKGGRKKIKVNLPKIQKAGIPVVERSFKDIKEIRGVDGKLVYKASTGKN